MATYPGMNLGGELRESVSLDEDDLSDVEDEVFIRDGKNGYRFAEDIGVKRPLMAPRRKCTKPDLKTRLKSRPPCALCKPCCYAFGILSVVLGLVGLVVVIVSIFPLPLDKVRDWLVTRSQDQMAMRLLPCSDLKITDVWSVSLPKLTSEASIRSLDVNGDGIEDIIFGFGTGDSSALHEDIFCPMFMEVASPCGGGLMALNGANGNVLWTRHLAHTIFTLFCSGDVNGDEIYDCLATGKGGVFAMISAKDGSIIWEFRSEYKDLTLLMDIYTANFIPDQDNDGVSDVLTAHTFQKDRIRSGHIVIVSGKTGKEIRRVAMPNDAETYYVPQLLPQQDGLYQVLFGTGNPDSPGNLSVVPLKSILAGNMTVQTIYEDHFKGILSPSVLVDITGDGQLDIVSAMFNSTIVAIDGSTFKQIWNLTINNSETLSIPTPGYFNDDNVTDFLVKYQTGPEFPVYYYSQTYIIDGKSGKLIYNNPIVDSVGSQMAGLTLRMEGYGYDFLLYWLADCVNYEGRKDFYEFISGSNLKLQSNTDICKLRFNSTKVAKLYALNQFEQPPGLELYNSESRVLLEYNNSKTPIEEATEYLKKHPEVQVKQIVASPEVITPAVKPSPPTVQVPTSAFRHKDNNQGLVKDYVKHPKPINNMQDPRKFEPDDYEQPQDSWQPKIPPNYSYQQDDMDYNNPYSDDGDPLGMYNKQMLIDEAKTNRDPRQNVESRSGKKHLGEDAYGPYGYKNIRQSRSRLMNDLNSLPTDILKDTFLKNKEEELRVSHLEQRDLQQHRVQETEDIRQELDSLREKMMNVSENLWDLESEKEMEDRANGLWRGKRQVNFTATGVQRISSVGTLVKSLDTSQNSIDLVFLTYWTPPQNGPRILTEKDYACIKLKIKNASNSKEEILNYEKEALEQLFKKECLEERGAAEAPPTQSSKTPAFPYYNQIMQLNLGQMTVYRIRIECVCQSTKKDERCARFLDPTYTWSSYLGKLGNGIFH